MQNATVVTTDPVATATNAVTTILSVCSVVAELWLLTCAYLFRFKSPLHRLLALYSILHLLGVLSFLIAKYSCVFGFLALQFWALATYLVSTALGINLLSCLFWKPKKETLDKLQWILYFFVIFIPTAITVPMIASKTITFGPYMADHALACVVVTPVYAALFSYTIPFFVLFVVNGGIFLTIVIKVYSSLKNINRRKAIVFYCLIAVTMGFWRIPWIPICVYYSIYGFGLGASTWARVLASLFVPSEGFVLMMSFSWYFGLFQLTFRRVRHLTSATEPLIDDAMINQNSSNSSGEKKNSQTSQSEISLEVE